MRWHAERRAAMASALEYRNIQIYFNSSLWFIKDILKNFLWDWMILKLYLKTMTKLFNFESNICQFSKPYQFSISINKILLLTRRVVRRQEPERGEVELKLVWAGHEPQRFCNYFPEWTTDEDVKYFNMQVQSLTWPHGHLVRVLCHDWLKN